MMTYGLSDSLKSKTALRKYAWAHNFLLYDSHWFACVVNKPWYHSFLFDVDSLMLISLVLLSFLFADVPPYCFSLLPFFLAAARP